VVTRGDGDRKLYLKDSQGTRSVTRKPMSRERYLLKRGKKVENHTYRVGPAEEERRKRLPNTEPSMKEDEGMQEGGAKAQNGKKLID